MGSVTQVDHRYHRRYIPGQHRYFAAVRPADRADYLVLNDDPAHPDLVASRWAPIS